MKAGKPKTYHLTRTMLTAMSELYAYIFCMLASRALVGMPIFGGALFMCARVGLEVARLKRVAEDGLTLGDLPCGHWRYLTGEELDIIKGSDRHE